jgi:hypothetical protein
LIPQVMATVHGVVFDIFLLERSFILRLTAGIPAPGGTVEPQDGESSRRLVGSGMAGGFPAPVVNDVSPMRRVWIP